MIEVIKVVLVAKARDNQLIKGCFADFLLILFWKSIKLVCYAFSKKRAIFVNGRVGAPLLPLVHIKCDRIQSYLLAIAVCFVSVASFQLEF